MYDFFYDFVKPTWGDKAEGLFTDTDSLALFVNTEDVYRDIAPIVDEWFDTSKYKPGNSMGLPAGVNAGVMQNTIRSRAHNMFTESLFKKALCPDDDKRVVLEDGIYMLPIGHHKINK